MVFSLSRQGGVFPGGCVEVPPVPSPAEWERSDSAGGGTGGTSIQNLHAQQLSREKGTKQFPFTARSLESSALSARFASWAAFALEFCRRFPESPPAAY